MPVTMETNFTMYNNYWITIVIDVCAGHAFTAQQVAFLPHILVLLLRHVLIKMHLRLSRGLVLRTREFVSNSHVADGCAPLFDAEDPSKSRVRTAQAFSIGRRSWTVKAGCETYPASKNEPG